MTIIIDENAIGIIFGVMLYIFVIEPVIQFYCFGALGKSMRPRTI